MEIIKTNRIINYTEIEKTKRFQEGIAWGNIRIFRFL